MAKLERKPGYITEFLEGKRGVSHGASLYHLRDIELDADTAVILAPFIQAYRPHTAIPKRAELEAAGYERIEADSFTDELYEHYFVTHGYYPEDAPEFTSG